MTVFQSEFQWKPIPLFGLTLYGNKVGAVYSLKFLWSLVWTGDNVGKEINSQKARAKVVLR